MTTIFKFLCVSTVAFLVHSEPYICENNYTSTNYINSLRVPTNCSATIPSYCPRSWKSGIPEGLAISKPFIYSEFIFCHEGFTSCGYVPINPKNGEVLGKSGVTVGSGVDLGLKSAKYTGFSNLSSSLVDKLKPYFGLQKNLAACAVIERPLKLTKTDATNLTNAVLQHTVENVENRYNKDKKEKTVEFLSLPRGIRTAIVSVWFQFGEPEAYPIFWSFVRENNWEGAINELRNFYGNPGKQQRGDLKRRNNEADVIEATLLKCNRTLDVVFLVHESGAISLDDYKESLNFVSKVITAFPDEKLRGDNNTRFGLSTFASYYNNEFSLSMYTSQHDYRVAIESIRQLQVGTNLSIALEKVKREQFDPKFRLRSLEHGSPLVLIILTFEPAIFDIKIPSQKLRDENIVLYSIGVISYEIEQLRDAATSRSHAYTIASLSDLEYFLGTLTSSLCNEPQPIFLNNKISSTTTNKQYQYYIYNVTGENLVINVIDVEGETLVYLSRSNPHPYKHENDLSYETSSRKSKLLVITPFALNVSKKSTGYQDMAPIFVSVLAKTETASYTIEGKACSPLKCKEGTNEDVSTARPCYKKSSNLFSSLVLLLLLTTL